MKRAETLQEEIKKANYMNIDSFTLIGVKLYVSSSVVPKDNTALLESNSIRLIVKNTFDYQRTRWDSIETFVAITLL